MSNEERIKLISLTRNTFPDLIAKELCAVQPMIGPVSTIFRMRPRYNWFQRMWRNFKKSRGMTLPQWSQYAHCGCPCHKGIPGHYHCWSYCCEVPNVRF